MTEIKMNGMNENTGAFFTKEDKKQMIIEKIKTYEARLDEYEDPTFHAYKALFNEIVRMESILASDFGMDEDEIWEATH